MTAIQSHFATVWSPSTRCLIISLAFGAVFVFDRGERRAVGATSSTERDRSPKAHEIVHAT